MNWENNFYRIIQVAEGDNGFNSTVELMEKHPIYEGHFPFESIVPGVCTLAIIRSCLSVYSDKNISFSKIKECKFISVIKPKAGLLISIDITFKKKNTISAIVYNNDNTVLKLKATIK